MYCVSSIVLFRLYDNDSDGSIDREDIEKVMEAMYKMVSPLLAQEKEGSNGEEGTEETNIISASMSARVKEICSKLDKVCMELCTVYYNYNICHPPYFIPRPL